MCKCWTWTYILPFVGLWFVNFFKQMVYLNPNRNLGMQRNELNHGISVPQQKFLYPGKWIESWYIWTPTELFVSREMNWIMVYLNPNRNICIQGNELNHSISEPHQKSVYPENRIKPWYNQNIFFSL